MLWITQKQLAAVLMTAALLGSTYGAATAAVHSRVRPRPAVVHSLTQP